MSTGSDTERNLARALTDDTLAHRLVMMSKSERSFSLSQRQAFLLEAARRLNPRFYNALGEVTG